MIDRSTSAKTTPDLLVRTMHRLVLIYHRETDSVPTLVYHVIYLLGDPGIRGYLHCFAGVPASMLFSTTLHSGAHPSHCPRLCAAL